MTSQIDPITSYLKGNTPNLEALQRQYHQLSPQNVICHILSLTKRNHCILIEKNGNDFHSQLLYVTDSKNILLSEVYLILPVSNKSPEQHRNFCIFT